VQVELFDMVQAHHWGLAAGYGAVTLIVSFAALAGATALVRRVRVIA
jgi:fluoride exporter